MVHLYIIKWIMSERETTVNANIFARLIFRALPNLSTK